MHDFLAYGLGPLIAVLYIMVGSGVGIHLHGHVRVGDCRHSGSSTREEPYWDREYRERHDRFCDCGPVYVLGGIFWPLALIFACVAIPMTWSPNRALRAEKRARRIAELERELGIR